MACSGQLQQYAQYAQQPLFGYCFIHHGAMHIGLSDTYSACINQYYRHFGYGLMERHPGSRILHGTLPTGWYYRLVVCEQYRSFGQPDCAGLQHGLRVARACQLQRIQYHQRLFGFRQFHDVTMSHYM
jgi:hypothetical protein